MSAEEQWYTVEEAAEVLNYSAGEIRQLIYRGILPAIKFRGGKGAYLRWYISQQAITAALQKQAGGHPRPNKEEI